jgi:hypothetical protein
MVVAAGHPAGPTAKARMVCRADRSCVSTVPAALTRMIRRRPWWMIRQGQRMKPLKS